MKRIFRFLSPLVIISNVLCLTSCLDIDTSTLSSDSEDTKTIELSDKQTPSSYVINTHTKIIHSPSCSSISLMTDDEKGYSDASYDELIANGFTPCGRCDPENWTPEPQQTEEYDYDTERIIREGHPVLFDQINTAKEFWENDLTKDAVVIRDTDHFDKNFPNAYLLLDSSKINDDSTVSETNHIYAIQASFYNCNDQEQFRLKDGIEIIRSYLPIEVLKNNYSLSDSFYQNISESTERNCPYIHYDYFTNYQLITEDAEDFPQWISVHIYLDGWGFVQELSVQPIHYKNNAFEINNWGYDFISNNTDYSEATCWDIELMIQYPRPSGSPALKKGTKSDEVGWLQSALKGVMHRDINVDCSFGNGTDSVVREFQSRCGLTPDGSVGSSTIEMLVDYASGKKELPEETFSTEPIVPEEEQVQTEPPSSPLITSDGYYILNTSKMTIHRPSCSALNTMNEENKEEYYGTVEELEAKGYHCCGRCHPK